MSSIAIIFKNIDEDFCEEQAGEFVQFTTLLHLASNELEAAVKAHSYPIFEDLIDFNYDPTSGIGHFILPGTFLHPSGRQTMRYPLPKVVSQRTVYRWQESVRDETHTHISTGVHGFESLCCSEMLAEMVEKAEISEGCKVTCPLCKIIWRDCQAFELCDFSNDDLPPPVTMPELSSVDPNIRALVTALNLNAFQTYASCQGHGFPAYTQKPYVAFIAQEEATKAFARRLREDAESSTPRLRWGWEVTASFNSDFVLCYRLQPTNPHCRVDRYRHRSLQQDFTALVSFLN